MNNLLTHIHNSTELFTRISEGYMTKLSESDFWCNFSYRLLEKEMHTAQAYNSHNQLFVLPFSPFALYLAPPQLMAAMRKHLDSPRTQKKKNCLSLTYLIWGLELCGYLNIPKLWHTLEITTHFTISLYLWTADKYMQATQCQNSLQDFLSLPKEHGTQNIHKMEAPFPSCLMIPQVPAYIIQPTSLLPPDPWRPHSKLGSKPQMLPAAVSWAQGVFHLQHLMPFIFT